MKKVIHSIMKMRSCGDVPYTYRDIDSIEELGDIKLHCVHAFCFCDSKLVLVFDPEKNRWTPPGGHAELGENAEGAVIREVKEETNMEVLKHKFIGFIEVEEPQGKMIQTRSVCIVKPYGPFVKDPDGDITEIKLIDPKDYKQYFDWGEIGDWIMERALVLLKEMEG
ncbi:MAG: NUDIX hydrolase [Candidatus Paceibacterota bacterium]|jgi:ADP-ribose pyrophosphatase YjhB (NUDIX family)